jgi:hypothetical protein
MVQSFIAFSTLLLSTTSYDESEEVARSYIRTARIAAGYPDTSIVFSRIGSAETKPNRRFFDCGNDHVVIDRISKRIVAFSLEKTGPNATPFQGDLLASGNFDSIATEAIRKAGWPDACIRMDEPILRIDESGVPNQNGWKYRLNFWRVQRPGVYWSIPVLMDIDSVTGNVLSFSLPLPCPNVSGSQTVDSPESAWNKIAADYLRRHPSTSYLQRITPLITFLDDPNEPGPIGATSAPDYESCRESTTAWTGFGFTFKVFVDAEFHHWANGVVDGRTGTYVRTGSSGGFGSSPVVSNLPWTNCKSKRFTFSHFKSPSTNFQGKVLNVRSSKAKPAGDLYLVASGNQVFQAQFDRKAKRLRWSYKKATLEAELDSGIIRSLLKQASK